MVRLMVRYRRYALVAAVLVVVLFLLGIANVLAAPEIKKFVIAGTILAAIVSGVIGAIFGLGLAKRN